MNIETNRQELLELAMNKFFPIHARLLQIFNCHVSLNDKVLDVGCGLKLITQFLKCKKVIGIDVWRDYLEPEDICADIRDINNIISPTSFEVAIALDLIEHLNKQEGLNLIKDLSDIITKRLIIFTPKQWSNNEDSFKNIKNWSFGNPYQAHKSLWTEDEFKKLGFNVIRHRYENIYIIAIWEKKKNQK